jgi:hypothetical protein
VHGLANGHAHPEPVDQYNDARTNDHAAAHHDEATYYDHERASATGHHVARTDDDLGDHHQGVHNRVFLLRQHAAR